MTNAPDEPLERPRQAADEPSGPRVPCEQSEKGAAPLGDWCETSGY